MVPKIHIVDDDRAIRDALSLLLQTEGYEVQAHESALTFLESVDPEERYGCVVTDVRMPGMSGIGLLEALRERRAALPIILITAHADIPLAIEAMKKGAADFFEKPFDDEALLASIRQALLRKTEDNAREQETQVASARFAKCTKREKEVLAALLGGKSNKVIAHDLGISRRTVEAHRATLMTKFEARSLPELVRLAGRISMKDKV